MKIELEIDELIYKDFVKLFEMFPKEKIKITSTPVTTAYANKINKYAGRLTKLSVDPIIFQEEIRNEWE